MPKPDKPDPPVSELNQKLTDLQGGSLGVLNDGTFIWSNGLDAPFHGMTPEDAISAAWDAEFGPGAP